ncbi:MAG: hypothetical protein RMK31_04885 [Candidatus Caldarchaeum sp.]|nr:hypothetical protein [Candidatus Caldarchaeum sp.]
MKELHILTNSAVLTDACMSSRPLLKAGLAATIPTGMPSILPKEVETALP